ncbi:MAG: TetR family transcriptional regulator [Micrococcales bacterium]|nr:TetR family transcriptional regulator [Micrococcales bacterium]
MVRTADHEARRRQLIEAAIEIAVGQGIDRVTVAAVARTAGVSVGLVQHYFPAKEELMRRAYAELLARLDARVARIVAAGEEHGDAIREMVPVALGELLPIGPRRTDEARVRLEFQTLAGRNPDLLATAQEHERRMRERLRVTVDNAKKCGETSRSADSSEVADDLWAAVTGAAPAMLVDPAFDGRRVLAGACQRAFPRECRRAART